MASENTELVVNEIYASVQGESSYAGLPCVFVRLTGCNLRCTYCDSEFAFYDGTRRAVASVVDEVRTFQIPLVEITGGEPLLQKACIPLAEQLLAAGFTVLIETSGERPIDVLPDGVIRIMDLKCPSSGECERNNWDNIAHLTPKDEVKFVIGDRADYDWMRDVIEQHRLTDRCAVLVSTVHGAIDAKTVVEWILADRLPVRFQLQLHKWIWDPAKRGV
ncbi:MAG: 7-carboxy-7-deazaguanine synthase QueE [Candidatus Zixiibacteriota bacterium]